MEEKKYSEKEVKKLLRLQNDYREFTQWCDERQKDLAEINPAFLRDRVKAMRRCLEEMCEHEEFFDAISRFNFDDYIRSLENHLQNYSIKQFYS
jgi:two-component sensor histidine kinase